MVRPISQNAHIITSVYGGWLDDLYRAALRYPPTLIYRERITERHYSAWVAGRQERLEADVRKAWNLD
jgi:hypothetical protein